MKIKLSHPEKANDAIVNLHNVPFILDYDKVSAALSTLGNTITEVSSIVKLKSRTNKAYYFDFAGDAVKLKNFFATYYNHMTWEEIQSKYGFDNRYNLKEDLTEKSKVTSKPTDKTDSDAVVKSKLLEVFPRDLALFFSKYNVNIAKIKYDKKNQQILLYDLGRDTISKIVNSVEVSDFFKKRGFEINYDVKDNPIKILLKTI